MTEMTTEETQNTEAPAADDYADAAALLAMAEAVPERDVILVAGGREVKFRIRGFRNIFEQQETQAQVNSLAKRPKPSAPPKDAPGGETFTPSRAEILAGCYFAALVVRPAMHWSLWVRWTHANSFTADRLFGAIMALTGLETVTEKGADGEETETLAGVAEAKAALQEDGGFRPEDAGDGG